MIGYLRTRVRKQPIIALYFDSETVLKFYNLEARWKDRIYEFDSLKEKQFQKKCKCYTDAKGNVDPAQW